MTYSKHITLWIGITYNSLQATFPQNHIEYSSRDLHERLDSYISSAVIKFCINVPERLEDKQSVPSNSN